MAEAFSSENRQFENKSKVAGVFIAIAAHAVILLLLGLLFIRIPNPPFPEDKSGVEVDVDYGNSETGMGDEEPAPNDDPSKTMGNTNQETSNGSSDIKPAVTANTPASSTTITQETEDAPIIADHKTDKTPSKTDTKPVTHPTTSTTPAAPTETKPTVNQNALFKGSGSGKGPTGNNPSGTSASQGNNPGFGNMGQPDGNKGNVYKGTGAGGDGDFSLANRACLAKSKPSVDCNEQGTVIVKIRVNKVGKVIDAKFTQAGSTTSSSCLVQAAERDAMRWQFNSDEDAAEVQQGTIKYVFKNR